LWCQQKEYCKTPTIILPLVNCFRSPEQIADGSVDVGIICLANNWFAKLVVLGNLVAPPGVWDAQLRQSTCRRPGHERISSQTDCQHLSGSGTGLPPVAQVLAGCFHAAIPGSQTR